MTVNMNNHAMIARLLFSFGLIILPVLPVTGNSPEYCESWSGYTDFSLDMRITSTTWRTDFIEQRGPYGQPSDEVMPPHCHVEGLMDERTGTDGKPYAIGFALNLPADWNGRFLFQGGAGLNGRAWDPVGLRASARNPALARGFAVASTDSGHQGSNTFDGSFVSDQEALINFYYRANARVTVLAKILIAEYYGSGANYSYFTGCSTGGREGMIMSQRYPYFYDGIVAGAPAMRTGDSNLALKWVSVSATPGSRRKRQSGITRR